MDISSSPSRVMAPLIDRRTVTTQAGTIRVYRQPAADDLRVASRTPSSIRAPSTPARGLPVIDPSGASPAAGPSWSEYLASGFDPKTSIWGEAGRTAYMTNRAGEVMRNLSREQVDQLMASCRNEAERAAIYNAVIGGPAHGYAREYLLQNHFGGDMNEMNSFVNYWNHINPACRPNFNAVTGELQYPDDRWDLDSATHTQHLNDFWMGDGLGTTSRALAGFTGVVTAGLA